MSICEGPQDFGSQKVKRRPRPASAGISSFSADMTSGFDVWSAGTRPKAIPVTKDSSAVKRRIRQSRLRSRKPAVFPWGSSFGSMDSRVSVVHRASIKPRTPPRRDSKKLSVRSWRMIRQRPAPRARQTAISRRRFVALPSNKFATLAQATR